MTTKKGGKVSKGVVKYHRISDYLEQSHPDVFQLLQNTGLYSALAPRRGVGRTFLLPDAKLTKKILKISESMELETASDMVGALIVQMHLATPEDWMKYKDDIPNANGKKVVVKGIKGDTVEIEGGTLTLDKKFVPATRLGKAVRGNTAVWKFKGEPELVTPDSTFKYHRPGAKKGGCGAATSKHSRTLLADVVAHRYKLFLEGKLDINPYYTVMELLIRFAKERNNQELLEAVRIAMPEGNVESAFYNLFEPFRKADKYLLSKELVGEFCAYSMCGSGSGCDTKKVLVDFINSEDMDALCCSAGGRKMIADERQKITGELIDRPGFLKTVGKINLTYADLEKNKLGALDKVLPPAGLALIATEPGRLAGMQELDFLVQRRFCKCSSKSEFNYILECIKNVQLISNYSIKATFSDVDRMRERIAPGPWFTSGPMVFIRTSSFLSTPRSIEDIEADGNTPEENLHPLQNGYYNQGYYNIEKLNSLPAENAFRFTDYCRREMKRAKECGAKLEVY